MIIESPKAMLFDGSLAAWGVWVVVHGAEAITALLTMTLLVIRIMIAWRQWRHEK